MLTYRKGSDGKADINNSPLCSLDGMSTSVFNALRYLGSGTCQPIFLIN